MSGGMGGDFCVWVAGSFITRSSVWVVVAARRRVGYRTLLTRLSDNVATVGSLIALFRKPVGQMRTKKPRRGDN